MVDSVIKVSNLRKYFKVLNRREGFWGTVKDLFSQDYFYVKAVDGISMEIKEGEIVGFLGPNGAGKSTTIKIMTGVLEPDGGEVLINNVIPYKDRIKNAKNIGVVFGQRTQLWWSLPLIESFKILKEIYEIDERTFKENLELFEEIIGIEALYRKPVRQMSLGQRVLCDILASFLHNPKVVFLDEPTIGLDILIKDKVRKLIKELNRRKNTTILLATHDMNDVEALCPRIIVIDKGKIIYDGLLEDLKEKFKMYRKAKIRVGDNVDEEEINKIKVLLLEKFNDVISDCAIKSYWLDISFKKQDVNLLEILRFITNFIPIEDIHTEDIQTEEVIKLIYEESRK
ncbi:ABC transporter ATP-binding protein [Dictyoglomus thermophilum]|uniref:ABC transporter ATP-binding protein n=1 Tax=Dictyoglomus thermophilum (strain ATCC 35947 / DSM 3960 / H-6-12) TaxID=309799 RepID=B5YBM3_DICT6|nr:ATP-binding cassette domain-containing protein [Dictyoglomus thermophilum]ACI19338.1 ABC transporter ATP-binding protein [Dictyoglomus thermophilum H-6-12]